MDTAGTAMVPRGTSVEFLGGRKEEQGVGTGSYNELVFRREWEVRKRCGHNNKSANNHRDQQRGTME